MILTKKLAGVIPQQQIPIEGQVPNVEYPALVVATPGGVDTMEELVGPTLLVLHRDGRENMRMVEEAGMEDLSHLNGMLMLHHLSFKTSAGKNPLHRLVNGLPTIAGKNHKGARQQQTVVVADMEIPVGKNLVNPIGLRLLPKMIG